MFRAPGPRGDRQVPTMRRSALGLSTPAVNVMTPRLRHTVSSTVVFADVLSENVHAPESSLGAAGTGTTGAVIPSSLHATTTSTRDSVRPNEYDLTTTPPD